MVPPSLLRLFCVTVVAVSAHSSILPSRLRKLTEDDQCYKNSQLPLQFNRCSSRSDVLGDARIVFPLEPLPCRSLCEFQSPAFLRPFHRAVDCDCCQRESDAGRYVILDDDVVNICVPRHVCIDECGLEKEGCVFTGSCGSQICFNNSNSGRPARIQRYTHRGPGTVIFVEDPENGKTNSTNSTNPREIPKVLYRGADYCRRNEQSIGFSSSKNCSLSPLGDGREGAAQHEQCRVACESFDYSPYEVVRIITFCNFCSTSDADEWYTPGPGNESHLCIPRQVCIDECGPEGYGCVYSGTCKSRICFSGIDSKKPAVFTILSDDGKENELSVNNKGRPVDADPPVFGPLGRDGNATRMPPKNGQSAASPSLSPFPPPSSGITVSVFPSPDASPSPSSSTTEFASTSPDFSALPPSRTPGPVSPFLNPSMSSLEDSPSPAQETFFEQPDPNDGNNGTIWVWLGPVIGVGILSVIALAAQVGIRVHRERARPLDLHLKPIHMLAFTSSSSGIDATPYSLPTPSTPVILTPHPTPKP